MKSWFFTVFFKKITFISNEKWYFEIISLVFDITTIILCFRTWWRCFQFRYSSSFGVAIDVWNSGHHGEFLKKGNFVNSKSEASCQCILGCSSMFFTYFVRKIHKKKCIFCQLQSCKSRLFPIRKYFFQFKEIQILSELESNYLLTL